MASAALKRILARKEFRVSEAEWLQLHDEEREAIRDYRQQKKIDEQTRGERIGNDKKEAVTVDAAELATRLTAVANKVNGVMEHQLGDVLPTKVFQVEELAEVVKICRDTLATIKSEMGKVWREVETPTG